MAPLKRKPHEDVDMFTATQLRDAPPYAPLRRRMTRQNAAAQKTPLGDQSVPEPYRRRHRCTPNVSDHEQRSKAETGPETDPIGCGRASSTRSAVQSNGTDLGKENLKEPLRLSETTLQPETVATTTTASKAPGQTAIGNRAKGQVIEQSQAKAMANFLPSMNGHTFNSGRIPNHPDRNIDRVVLGNICFPTWYPSYYGKEVLGLSWASGKGAGTGTGKNTSAQKAGNQINSCDPTRNGRTRVEDVATKTQAAGKKDKVLDLLYVCPCCFKYSKELVPWWEHVRLCERSASVPGRKIYEHPKGAVPKKSSAAEALASSSKGRRPNAQGQAKYEGEWSVWKVDGQQDLLFCQNLSLFAKLFLDNKSVFFDVTGFNYFLLVYTPPPHHPTTIPTAETALAPPRPLIVGFFSKEKISWDNNNLACILVFPPWQRKGLGALLMGVSYEISRREGVLGGPEKPISELGRKGYKRFWAGKVARWILELDLSQPQQLQQPQDDTDDQAEDGHKEPKATVSVEHCSSATWIAQEDCLVVLREMDVLEDLGPEEETDGRKEQGALPQKQRGGSFPADDGDAKAEAAGDEDQNGDEEKRKKEKPAHRIRLDKAAVREWVRKHGIGLERTCDPDGFVEGYAVPAEPFLEDTE